MLSGNATSASYPHFCWEVPWTSLSSLLIQRQIYPSSISFKYPEHISKTQFSPLTLIFYLFSKSGAPNQLIPRKQSSDFTDSFLLLNLPAAAVSVIVSIPVFQSNTQTASLPRTHHSRFTYCHDLISSSSKRCFSHEIFWNQISVFFPASAGVICNFTCHSSD